MKKKKKTLFLDELEIPPKEFQSIDLTKLKIPKSIKVPKSWKIWLQKIKTH